MGVEVDGVKKAFLVSSVAEDWIRDEREGVVVFLFLSSCSLLVLVLFLGVLLLLLLLSWLDMFTARWW